MAQCIGDGIKKDYINPNELTIKVIYFQNLEKYLLKLIKIT